MQLTKTINVITLASLLFLTGCFGITDDTVTPDANGQNQNGNILPVNNAPFIQTSTDYLTFSEISSTNTTTGNVTFTGYKARLYYAAIDIDSDNLTLGWDINLDGAIDIPMSDTFGFADVEIPIEYWLNPFTSPSTQLQNNTLYAMIAFIAVDEHGLGNVVFVELSTERHYYSINSLYMFDAEDAAGSPTDANNDTLVRVTMTQGSDINWAAISVKISVNNGAPITCNNPGAEGATLGCDLVEFGDTSDQFWSVTDGVTISESGQNLCDASEPCSIKVTVGNTQEGKTLDESSTIAS